MEIVIGSIRLKWDQSIYVPRKFVPAVDVMALKNSPDVVIKEGDCMAFGSQKNYSTEGREVIREDIFQRRAVLGCDGDVIIDLVVLLVKMLVKSSVVQHTVSKVETEVLAND